MSAREYCLIGINSPGVVDLPEVDRRGQVERAIGPQQVRFDLLVVAVDERGAEPVAGVRARDVYVDVLFARVRAAYLTLYKCLCQAARGEVLRECVVVGRDYWVRRVFQVASS